ncbi:PAS domain S-box-containing protein [Sporobacter termitidis DSM 10068]|uniref:histidine kinase n=1 Tax=Sporobacter termitidis DSM 10068 TaxID=1123282 RepID=A0A1M5YGL6_9FIRM|nr:PAS domain S-box-containing protein [Sporobacter termitidis DSM 10068]
MFNLYRCGNRRVISDTEDTDEILALQEKMLDLSNDAIFAWKLNGGIIYWNDGASKLYGYTKREAVGTSSHSLLQAEYPSDPHEFITVLNEKGEWSGNLEHVTKAGKKIVVEARRQVIVNSRQQKIVLETNRDITEQTRIAVQSQQDRNRILANALRLKDDLLLLLMAAKNDLAAEVETLNTLYKLNSNFIVKRDLPTVYSEILHAAITETHTSKGSIQLFDEDSRKLIIILSHGLSGKFQEYYSCIGLDAGSCGKAYQRKRRIIVKDVRLSPIFKDKPALSVLLSDDILSEQSTPLISSSGKIVGVLNTYYSETKSFSDREIRLLDMIARLAADVIERTNTEYALLQSEQNALKLVEELKKSDKNKNVFLNTLSHELRNPLATIVTGLSLMDMLEINPKNRETLDIVIRQTRQLRRLIDDLLDLTRLTNNKIKLKKEQFDLNKLAQAVVRDNTLIFQERDVDLDIEMGDRPVFITADPVRISQIIGNLLNNSLKFSKAGGKTTLSVKTHDSSAFVIVKDNGKGIDAKFLPELFEPFKQADSSLDRQNGGLGLGLSIVKGIAELHGGSVSAYSDGIGKGAQFTIFLPAMCPAE